MRNARNAAAFSDPKVSDLLTEVSGSTELLRVEKGIAKLWEGMQTTIENLSTRLAAASSEDGIRHSPHGPSDLNDETLQPSTIPDLLQVCNDQILMCAHAMGKLYICLRLLKALV